MKNKNKLISVLFLTLGLVFVASFFIFPKTSRAVSPKAVINELMWMGSSVSTADEWIELRNMTSEKINFSKTPWSIYKNDSLLLIIDQSQLEPLGYFLISSHKEDHKFSKGESALNISPDLVKSFSLSNSLVAYFLYDSSDNISGSLIDTAGNPKSKNQLAGENKEIKLSMERNDTPGDGAKEENWHSATQAFNFDLSSPDLGTPRHSNSPAKEKPSEKELSFSVKKDKNIYKNIFASFEADFPEATSATKYTWNFGDGHKSYLKKTRHKYNNSGTYEASLTLRGDKKATKTFEVEVREFDAPKIKIIRFSPNPKGRDSKNEWIEIKNNSDKKVNLKNWIIATGWKKLINHKITKKFVLKSGETKKITSKHCAFTLNNTQNKIELQDPSGKTIQKIKYNRKKNKIEEDEVFEKSGKNWEGIKTATNEQANEADKKTKNIPGSEEEINQNSNEENLFLEELVFVSPSEIEASVGKYTKNPLWKNKEENRIRLIGYGTAVNTPLILLKNQGRVLGISTERITIPEKHWAVLLWNNSTKKINFSLNWILNKI